MQAEEVEEAEDAEEAEEVGRRRLAVWVAGCGREEVGYLEVGALARAAVMIAAWIEVVVMRLPARALRLPARPTTLSAAASRWRAVSAAACVVAACVVGRSLSGSL